MPKITTSADFWDKVDKTGECWIWTGHIDKHGYGRHGASYAHRHAYELHKGKSIPEGAQVDHICHVRGCVRPSHLRAVTNKQNGENRKGPNCNSTSGVRGVTWNKRHEKWCAKFRHNREYIYVGMYDRLEDAEKAIIAKRNKVFTCNQADRKKVSRSVSESQAESGVLFQPPAIVMATVAPK